MKRHAIRFLRAVEWSVGLLAGVAVVLIALMHYGYIGLGDHKELLTRYLSDALDRPVSFQSLTTRWQGTTAVMRVGGLRLHQRDGLASTLRLGELELQADLWSLLQGRLDLTDLTVVAPTLEVLGEADGGVRLGDYQIGGGQGGRVEWLPWLLKQGGIRVRDATLVWHDLREPEQTLMLTNLALQVGGQGRERRVTASLECPPALCTALTVSGTLHGSGVSRHPSVQGKLDISMEQLDISRLPLRLRERVPWLRRGKLDAQVTVLIEGGLFAGAAAEFELSDFDAAYGSRDQRLRGPSFHTRLAWRRDARSWRVSINRPRLTLENGRVLAIDELALETAGERRLYSAEQVDIGQFVDSLHSLGIPLPGPAVIDKLAPEGLLATASLSMEGPFLKPEDWRFEGRFSRLGWRAQDRIPGAAGLTGSVALDPSTGRLRLHGAPVEVDFGAVLREPFRLARFDTDVRWVREGDRWLIDVAEMNAANGDFEVSGGRLYARVPHDNPAATYVDASIDVPRLAIDRIEHYIPAKIMKPKGVAWIDRALAAGTASDGRVELSGLIKAFPFRDGSGRFHARTRVTEGTLDYAPRWPPISGIDAAVRLDNQRFEVHAERGVMMNTRLENVSASAEDMFIRTRVVEIDGALAGPLNDVSEFLLRGPLSKKPSELDIAGLGQGQGTLHIELPFTRLKQARVRGEYTVDGAGVRLPTDLTVSQLRGKVVFTDKTVEGKGVTGRLMGGPLTVDVNTVTPRRPPVVRLAGAGHAEAGELERFLGRGLVARLSGSAPWRGSFLIDRDRARLEVDSALLGVGSELPAPLAKTNDSPLPARVDVDFLKSAQRVRFDVGERLAGLLAYRKDASGTLKLKRGQIRLQPGAQATLAPAPGLSVVVIEDSLDADPWIDLFVALARGAGNDPPPATSRERAPLVAALRKLDLKVDAMRFLERDIGAMQMLARSEDSRTWEGTLAGDIGQAAARARFLDSGAEFDLNMPTLHWPRAKESSPPHKVISSDRSDPSAYVELSINALDFRFGDMDLGRLRLRAGPEGDRWRIGALRLDQPSLRIDAEGEWLVDAAGRSFTRIRSTAKLPELGTALGKLGFEGYIDDGSAEVSAEFEWRGAPGEFRFENLDGRFQLNAENGSFPSLDPGSGGRLLGLFNVESFSRRLSLDFSDIFSKGLAFDRITGEGTIVQGDLLTDGLYVVGPAALIETRGRAGLAAEDYDLELVVIPQVGGNLSLFTALANPAAGAVIFVMQKVFKKQLAKAVHYRYHVTGPWLEPAVEPVGGIAEESGQASEFELGADG